MTTILPRRGTAAQWTAANPILAAGETGLETDTNQSKRGDGVTAWTALPYVGKWDSIPGKPAVVAEGATQAAARNAVAALGLIQAAKNPDLLVTGAVTVDNDDLITSAAVVWPDGTPGTLTITSRDANNSVLAYNITYGSPVTKTYTQPPITRNANGAATNIPAIVVS